MLRLRKRLLERPAYAAARAAAYAFYYKLRAFYWPARPSVVNAECRSNGSVVVPLLISTQHGLFYHCDGSTIQLLKGRFFGICKAGGTWLAYHEPCAQYGQLLAFQIADGCASNVRIVRRAMRPGVHQVDCDGERVYIADTPNNRVVTLTVGRLSGPGTTFYPAGKARRGAANYVHLNSVYRCGRDLVLVFHNDSFRSGRCSEILITGEATRRIPIGAWCAHNFAVWNNKGIVCNSGAGTLRIGRSGTVYLGYFTRGLAIGRDIAYVGASRFAPRESREKHDGVVFAVDLNTGRVVAALEIPHVGSVYEVRLLDSCDLGCSMVGKQLSLSAFDLDLPTDVVDSVNVDIRARCG